MHTESFFQARKKVCERERERERDLSDDALPNLFGSRIVPCMSDRKALSGRMYVIREKLFCQCFYSAAASSAGGASPADSVAVAPSPFFFFFPKASAPKAGFSFSSPRSNFWSGFVDALSPDLKAAALAESESPDDFLIFAAVLFTRFSCGFMNLPVPSLTERVSSFMSKSCFMRPYSTPKRFSSDSMTQVYRVLHFSIKSSSS